MTLEATKRINSVMPEDVQKIVQMASEWEAEEICGIIITGLHGENRVIQLPNRAKAKKLDTVIDNDDLLDALMIAIPEPSKYPGLLKEDLVVWHTHPGGKVGPSKTDMDFKRQKMPGMRCLVVTLPHGEAVQF